MMLDKFKVRFPVEIFSPFTNMHATRAKNASKVHVCIVTRRKKDVCDVQRKLFVLRDMNYD